MQADQAYHDLEAIFRAGVEQVDPRRLVTGCLLPAGDRLTVTAAGASALELDLSQFKKIVVLGAGKAAAAMAAGLEEVLGERISGGLIVVKYGHTEALSRIRTVEAGHPLPDANGVRGAEAIAELAAGADAQTLVIGLISGGGSALLPAPYWGRHAGGELALSLEDKQDTTRALLACGATIQEVNCIRKHISRLKGGRLAALLHPARTLNLILSDVVGDRLDTIASGLTVPDDSTYGQALAIVSKYGIESRLPPRVLELLRLGAAGRLPETPKAGDPVFAAVHNVLLGTNYTALSAAAHKAEELGYRPVLLSSRLVGEAREAARVLAAIALDVKERGLLAAAPACLLAGGETTVTLRGEGKGGRNQELALSFLAEIEEAGAAARDIYFLSGATDGSDGPTDAAGAFASLQIAELSRRRGLSIQEALQSNDSYHFYQALGRLLRTGPTRTNVCDMQICLVR